MEVQGVSLMKWLELSVDVILPFKKGLKGIEFNFRIPVIVPSIILDKGVWIIAFFLNTCISGNSLLTQQTQRMWRVKQRPDSSACFVP